MRGLYAIADVTTLTARGVDIVAFVRALAPAKPAAIQLRAKDLSARETLALLRALVPICRDAGVLLVANDRVDVAAVGGCDGVHLGQEDLPLASARRLAPHLRVGVSTHDLAQLGRALEERPDYVAYGPVYPTASKVAPDAVVGIAGLRAAYLLSRAAGIPLVAIGGITLERGREVSTIADAGAVIADLFPSPRWEQVELAQVTVRAERLHAALSAGADGGVRAEGVVAE